MLKIKTFTFNMFGVNTYLLWNPLSLHGTIIDPGMINPGEQCQLDDFIAEQGITIDSVINTHMHIDHIFGDIYVKNRYGVDLSASEDDAFLGERVAAQCRMFGLPENMANVEIDRQLNSGDIINIGGDDDAVILTVPGHSPGSIVVYVPSMKWAITGDVLFKGSIGRTDLTGGNHQQLLRGIHTKLLTLPADTVVYPGHGGPTTIGREASSNPYLRSR